MTTLGRTRSSSRTASNAALVSTSTKRSTRSQAQNPASASTPQLPFNSSSDDSTRSSGSRRVQPPKPESNSSTTPKLSARGVRARTLHKQSAEQLESVVISTSTRPRRGRSQVVGSQLLPDSNDVEAIQHESGAPTIKAAKSDRRHMSLSPPPEIDMTEDVKERSLNGDSYKPAISSSSMEIENGPDSKSTRSPQPPITPPWQETVQQSKVKLELSKKHPSLSPPPISEAMATDDASESGPEFDPTLSISGKRSRQPSLQPFLSYEDLELENQVQDREFYDQLQENSITFSPSSIFVGPSTKNKTDQLPNGQSLFNYNSWRRMDHRQYYLDDVDFIREGGDPNQHHQNNNNESEAFDFANGDVGSPDLLEANVTDDEDDPFGFSKVNRRQQWSMKYGRKPRFVAVNQTQRQFVGLPNITQLRQALQQHQRTPSQSQSQSPKSSSLKQISHGSVSSTDPESTSSSPAPDTLTAARLRMAERRRGNAIDKGKSVLRGYNTPPQETAMASTPSPNETNVSEENDPALARALQLSLETAEVRGPSLLIERQGDASSSRPPRGTAADTLKATDEAIPSARDSREEASPILIGTEEVIDKVASRSSRRLSRFIKQWEEKESNSTASLNKDSHAPTRDVTGNEDSTMRTAVRTLRDRHPGPRASLGSLNPISRSRKGFDLSRASKRNISGSDISDVNDDDDNDDGRLPIVFSQSPMKNPEAGMPLSMESLSSSAGWHYLPSQKGTAKTTMTARPSKKRRLRTEDLEALLPKSRRNLVGPSRRPQPTGESVLRKSKRVQKQQIQELSEDTSNDKTYELEDEGQDEVEEDEEPLIRRRRRPTTTAVPAETRAPPTTVVGTTKSTGAGVKLSKIPKMASKPLSTKARRGSVKEAKGKEPKRDNSGADWTSEQWESHKKRLEFFKEVDGFELDVETTR